MPVIIDTHSIAATVFSATSITTPSFTVGSGANRAAVLGLGCFSNISSVTASLGGVAATLVPGTDQFTTGVGSRLMALVAPPSGSQTATASWTTASTAELTVVVVLGVRQNEPMEDGTKSFDTFNSQWNLVVTSSRGNLTTTLAVFGNGSPSSGIQLSTGSLAGCDVGSGSGSQDHIWTASGEGAWAISGANFVRADGIFTQVAPTHRML